MQYSSMALLLILICTSLRFSEAFPVLYRSLKHTGHAETYEVSILPTYFTSKLRTKFDIEYDYGNFHRNNYNKSCVSCHNSSVVPEGTVMDQEASSLSHSLYTVTTQFSFNSSKLMTRIETKDINTIPINTVYSSEVPTPQNETYIPMAPAGIKEESMTEEQRLSTPHYSTEEEKLILGIYSTLKDTISGYIDSVGYGSTRGSETLEETTLMQLEDPTKIDQTTEHHYSYVPTLNYEYSLGMESITSGYIPNHSDSKDTELRNHEDILHTSVKVLNQHVPTANYNTESTAREIEGHGLITSNQGITVMKHKPFSTPQLTHQGTQTTILELKNSTDIELRNHEDILHTSVKVLNQHLPTANYNTESTTREIEGHRLITSNQGITVMKHKPFSATQLTHQGTQKTILELTNSKDTELRNHEEILHTSIKLLNQHVPTAHYNTKSTAREIDGHRLITSNQGITVMKHKLFSTPQLTHQGTQTAILELFTDNNSTNETRDKIFKTTEYEEKTSLMSPEENIKATSKKNENSIVTTQQTEVKDSLMLASIITTPTQQNSNLVTLYTEKFERTDSNFKQLPTAVAKKEQTYNSSSVLKHVKESHSMVLDTSFQMSTVPTKEVYSTEYNEPSIDTSLEVIQTADQKPRHEHYREMEKMGLSDFTLVDRDQLKDVEYLGTTEFENEFDIETLDISSNKSNNSEERAEIRMYTDNARMPTSQGPQINGEQNNYVSLSYEYDNRTGINPQQRFTSRSKLRQSTKDLEMQEIGKKLTDSGGYYPDEKRPEGTESMPTAPVVTTVKQLSTLQITNQGAREELHPGQLENHTLSPNAQEKDAEKFELIEHEEELNLATTTVSPVLRSAGRKGKIGKAAMPQQHMESMRVSPKGYDERDRKENNSTLELRRKEKPHKHFEVEELEERAKLGKLKSKDGGSKNRGENITKTTNGEAVTSSKFVKIMKIKKQKSTVVSQQGEQTTKAHNIKNFKLNSRIMQINESELVSNFTKIMKQKKQKFNVTAEEQRKMYQNKNVTKTGFHETGSNFTKRMKVRILKGKTTDEAPLNESVGHRKTERKRLQEQKSVTIFIKKRKIRKPKQTVKGRDDVDKTGAMSKLNLSEKLQDQRRHFGGVAVSNFTKIRRGKKQKHTLKYSGGEETHTAEGPENLEYDKKKNSSRWQFSRKISGKDGKYEDLEILDHELPISKSNEQKFGKLKERNGKVKGKGNTNHFHFQRKDRKILAKKENVSTNEKTEEGIHQDALMLLLNLQKDRMKDKSEVSKYQPEKTSPYLKNTKEPERRMDIQFRITKKNKFPRFALDVLKTTVFVKRKKLVKILPQKTTTLLIPVSFPYQHGFFKILDQSKSTGIAQTVPKSKVFTNTEYLERKQELPEKSMDLYLPTIASYQSRFPGNKQRKNLVRYPIKLPVPTLFTLPKEYITHVVNTYQSSFRKRPKVMKYSKYAVTKPMSMSITIWKGRKLDTETNKSTSLAHTELTNWNRKKERPEKPKYLFIPTTTSYQSEFLEKDQTKYFSRYPLKLPIPTLFTKSKAKYSSNTAAKTYQSRFRDSPKEIMSTKFAVTKPMSVWFTVKKGHKFFMEKPEKTAGLFYPKTVAYETSLFKVPKIMDSTVLVPTIPIPLSFTKRKRTKLKAINTTVSFSPITVFRQNKFDSFPDGNIPHETALTSNIPRIFTKWRDRKLKVLPAKTVVPFIPTRRSYISKFHELSTPNEKYRPAVVLPVFKKRIGQGRTKEMTTRVTELFYPVTNAYERKQQGAQTERKLTMDDVTLPVFSFLTKWKEKKLRRKWPLKASTPTTVSHETAFSKTPKQERRIKLPVTKADWMFRHFTAKNPKCTAQHTTVNLTIETTTSETQYSERPSEGTCAETTYADQDLTCPAGWTTPTQTTDSDSDSSTGDIYDENSSSIPTPDTSQSTDWFTLDSTPSNSEPSLYTSTQPALISHTEPPTTEETTTDTGDTDGPLTSLPVGNRLGGKSPPVIWIGTITFKPSSRWTTDFEQSSLTSVTSAHVSHDDHPAAEETTTDMNSSSATVSSTIEETNIFSTSSMMNLSSVSSTTEYDPYHSQGIHTERSSTTAYEFSVSNVPQLITEPSTTTTSDYLITKEITAFYTDWSSTTPGNTDYEFPVSNVTQLTTDSNARVTSDSQNTHESSIVNQESNIGWEDTTALNTDSELSISNVSKFTSEPSIVTTTDSQIIKESTIVGQDNHTDWLNTIDSNTEYQFSVSNVPEFTTESSTLRISEYQITRESTVLNEDFHTNLSSTTALNIDTEISVSNVPPFTSVTSTPTIKYSRTTEESTTLNEDYFRTHCSSITATNNEIEVTTLVGPKFTGESSTLAASDSQTIQESSTLNEDFYADWSSTTARNTEYVFTVSNGTQFTTEYSTLTPSDSRTTQESTIPNEDYFHTDFSSSGAPNNKTEVTNLEVPQFTSEQSTLIATYLHIPQESSTLNEDFRTDRTSTVTSNAAHEFSFSNVSQFTRETSTPTISDSRITHESTSLNEDYFHTDWSSTTATNNETEFPVLDISPQFTSEPSTLAANESQITQGSSTLNEDSHTDWSSTVAGSTGYEFSVSNVSQFTTEPCTLKTSDSRVTQEATTLNEDYFHTDWSSTTATNNDLEFSILDVPHFTSEPSTLPASDSQITQGSITSTGLIFAPSTNTRPLYDLHPSNGISVSSLTSPLSTPIIPEVTSFTHSGEDTELQDRLDNSLTDGSSTTARNFETEVSNTMVSQLTSKSHHVGTDDLILSSSIKTSPISSSPPSTGETIASSKSSLSTSLTEEIASTKSEDVHSPSLDGVQQGSDSAWPVLTVPQNGTKSSTSFVSPLVGEGVSGHSTTWSNGSVPWTASTLNSLSTPALKFTKQRTCKRVVKTSQTDSVSCAIPTPFLTLRPTLRRRLKTTTPSST